MSAKWPCGESSRRCHDRHTGNVRICLACGVTDMRRGFDSLAHKLREAIGVTLDNA